MLYPVTEDELDKLETLLSFLTGQDNWTWKKRFQLLVGEVALLLQSHDAGFEAERWLEV